MQTDIKQKVLAFIDKKIATARAQLDEIKVMRLNISRMSDPQIERAMKEGQDKFPQLFREK